MSTQRKYGTSLNDERQRKLAEIVDAEPLACPSAVLAVSLDVMHELWHQSGRDLKTALHAIRKLGEPGEKFLPQSEMRAERGAATLQSRRPARRCA